MNLIRLEVWHVWKSQSCTGKSWLMATTQRQALHIYICRCVAYLHMQVYTFMQIIFIKSLYKERTKVQFISLEDEETQLCKHTNSPLRLKVAIINPLTTVLWPSAFTWKLQSQLLTLRSLVPEPWRSLPMLRNPVPGVGCLVRSTSSWTTSKSLLLTNRIERRFGISD